MVLKDRVDEPSRWTEHQAVTAEVNRPVQYLGSKMRVLPLLTEIIGQGREPESRVWDAFSGSSVVSQALANARRRVVASDALMSSACFAQAALAVGRTQGETSESALDKILMVSRSFPQPAYWNAYLHDENETLLSGDGAALLAANARLPQRWKQHGGRELGDLSDHFALVEASSKRGEILFSGLLSTVYAGTYFSLHQTLRLEQIRGAIEALSSSGLISPWTKSVALTALSTAASQAVFSAGKHFAQPHRIREGKDMTFHAKRALTDRSVDIDAVFANAMKSVAEAAQPADSGHMALTRRVEDVTVENLQEWRVDTVYADPPYTAQQYSRFYHLLETLHAGVPPVLQDFRGSVTRGLYPEDRFKSAFCSKREAPNAFDHFIRMSKDAGARLVISYSGNEGELTGNARTIAMDDLKRLLVKSYGVNRVSVQPVQIRYRQFNHALSEVAGRNDPEYVLIGDTSAS